MAIFDPKMFDEMARKIVDNLPPGIRDFQQEMEKNVRATLQSTFARLDLITREEFDAQAKVLARGRAQLDTLETRIAALEAAAAAVATIPAEKKPKP